MFVLAVVFLSLPEVIPDVAVAADVEPVALLVLAVFMVVLAVVSVVVLVTVTLKT